MIRGGEEAMRIEERIRGVFLGLMLGLRGWLLLELVRSELGGFEEKGLIIESRARERNRKHFEQ